MAQIGNGYADGLRKAVEAHKNARGFNINDHVWVKLNEIGIGILQKENEYFQERIPNYGEFKDPRNSEGYAKIQLWDLMQRFGPHMRLGSMPPFDTEIILVEPSQATNNQNAVKGDQEPQE